MPLFNELTAPRPKAPAGRATPDLLYYSHLVDQGIAGLKDGSLLRSYRVRGPDLKSASVEELLALKHHGNQAMVRLDDSWMLQWDLVRYPVQDYMSGGAFPDPVTRLIERERELHYKAEGEHFETDLYLSLTWKPPSERESWARRLFFTQNAPDDQRNLTHFRTSTDAFAHDLSAELDVEPLDSGGLLSFIESCIIGEQGTIRQPAALNYLDLWLGRERLVTGLKPTIGGRAIRVVIPTGLPPESHGEVSGFLTELPFPYRYSIRAILLGTENANRVISKRRKEHHQKILRLWDFLKQTTGTEADPQYRNEHAVEMADDANEAVREAHTNLVRYLYLSLGVVLIGKDVREVEDRAEQVRKLFSHYGFRARIEDFNTVEAWRGFLPGDGSSNVRKPLVSSQNLADLMPMTTLWTGELSNPNPMYPADTPPLFYATSDGQTPFRFHMHVGDVGHGIIIGPIGTGKSTLVDFMIAQAFRIPDLQVFVFDKGYSSFILTKACGGQHWDLGNDPITAAPLINVDQEIEREWAHGYVGALLHIAIGRPLTPPEDEAVWRALELLAGRRREFRTMTALQGVLQDNVLKAGLARYTLKGPMGRYIDATTDALLEARFTTFELDTLQHNEALIPMLLYLFHRIEQRLDGRPTLVVVDEAWVALTKSFFGGKLEEWLRTLRKKNAAVWLATQSLDDLRQSEYRSVVLESCPTKIYLPSAEAQTPNMAAAYRDFGLTDRQIEIIADSIPKRHYYLVSPKGRRLFDLALGPVALSFVGASGKADLQRARELIAQYGQSWIEHWLRGRGLGEWADQLEPTLDGHVQMPAIINEPIYRNGQALEV